MPDRIFLPPGVTDASVVLVGDVCYERVGSSEQSPTVLTIEGEYDSCSDCEGDSSSSTDSGSNGSGSGVPCSDCAGWQPMITVSGGSCSPCTVEFSGSASFVYYNDFTDLCLWGWAYSSGTKLWYVELTYDKTADTWEVFVSYDDSDTGENHAWVNYDAGGLRCDEDSGEISGTVSVDYGAGHCNAENSASCDSVTVNF